MFFSKNSCEIHWLAVDRKAQQYSWSHISSSKHPALIVVMSKHSLLGNVANCDLRPERK